MKTKRDQDEMDCEFCGKKNEERTCTVFGAPTEDVPFSMNLGRGVICLDCFKARGSQLGVRP